MIRKKPGGALRAGGDQRLPVVGTWRPGWPLPPGHAGSSGGAGEIDVLVNNAGIGTLGPTQGFDEATFDSIFGTNLKVPFYLVGEIAPAMAERGKGSIINVSTMAAEMGVPGMAVYGASKAALNLLTQSWAAEYGPS